MIWKIEFTNSAEKEFAKLQKLLKKRIRNFLRARIQNDPKSFGENLDGIFKGLRRYRVGDYRLICYLDKEKVTVLLLRIGHRSEAYPSHFKMRRL
jgi:mRNA interferase RelE/StbE